MTDPVAPAPPAEDPPSWRSRPLLALGVGAFVVMTAFWAWAFAASLSQRNDPPTSRNPDYLEDRAWVRSAETTCAGVMEQIDRRTVDSPEQSPAERATTIDASTDELEAMLDALRSPMPTGDGDADVVDAWFADWDQLISDRRAYAVAVRTDPDARFLTVEKFGDPLDRVVATFAEINEMKSCGPAGDVG